jgi:hypothetical protein
MSPRVIGKACQASPLTNKLLISKALREISLSSFLLFVGLAILAPTASAQQPGYIPANFTFGSINGAPHRCINSDQTTDDCDLLEFSNHNIVGGAPVCDWYGAGSGPYPPGADAVASSQQGTPNCGQESPATLSNSPPEDSKNHPPDKRLPASKPPDFNRDIYYKNKFEFSQDVGWLPINIPFPLDVFTGDAYQLYPLKYTLVPILLSLRWHMDDIKGPVVLRGNWDLTMPRGPETRYFAYIMGIRRNFVPRNWRVAPYFDIRLGLGDINARAEAPYYVQWAQGQDFTFTINSGSGLRYNFNPRFAASVGLNWMHISNMDLSEPAIRNTGINVYGPMLGIDIRVSIRRRHAKQQ